MKLNLVVIKTLIPDELAKQYELLGFKFDRHKHVSGPFHYAAEAYGLTFEIYPLPKAKTESDDTTRLGFEVSDLKSTLDKISNSNWKIVSEPVQSEFGYTAIIEDLDGRKIELKES